MSTYPVIDTIAHDLSGNQIVTIMLDKLPDLCDSGALVIVPKGTKRKYENRIRVALTALHRNESAIYRISMTDAIPYRYSFDGVTIPAEIFTVTRIYDKTAVKIVKRSTKEFKL